MSETKKDLAKIYTTSEVKSATATFDLSPYPEDEHFSIAKALIVVQGMSVGKSLDEAGALIGMTRGGLTSENWRRWLSIAKRMLIRDIIMQVNAGTISIMEKYNGLVTRMIEEAMLAPDPMKMLPVVQWIKREIIDPASHSVQEIGNDELTAAADASKRNFNPLMVLERLTINGSPSENLQRQISSLILEHTGQEVNEDDQY